MNTVNNMIEAMGDVMKPVHTEPLFMESGIQVPSRKVVVDSTSQTPIAVVSDRYELVSNERAYSEVAEAIVSSSLDMTDMSIDTSVETSRSVVKFTFPAHQIDLKGDKTNLQLVARNSYDGSWKVETMAGAFRIACANGQVFGKYLKVFSGRHDGKLDMSIVDDRVDLALEAFEVESGKWATMADISITEAQVLVYLARYFHADEVTMKQLGEMNQGKFHHGLQVFRKYAKEMGQNYWAMYNTLTDLSTRRNDGMEQALGSNHWREGQVRKVIGSVKWNNAVVA